MEHGFDGQYKLHEYTKYIVSNTLKIKSKQDQFFFTIGISGGSYGISAIGIELFVLTTANLDLEYELLYSVPSPLASAGIAATSILVC